MHGKKEIDTSSFAENCLFGTQFLVTGILDSLEREEAHSLIMKYGGKIVKTVTKKCTHVLVGREPGEAKMRQVGERKDIVKVDGEDSLFELLRASKARVLSEQEASSLQPKIKIPFVTPNPPSKPTSSSSSSSSSSSNKGVLVVSRFSNRDISLFLLIECVRFMDGEVSPAVASRHRRE